VIRHKGTRYIEEIETAKLGGFLRTLLILPIKKGKVTEMLRFKGVGGQMKSRRNNFPRGRTILEGRAF